MNINKDNVDRVIAAIFNHNDDPGSEETTATADAPQTPEDISDEAVARMRKKFQELVAAKTY